MEEIFKSTSLNHTLKELGLKVTPQRIAVLEALLELKDHPTAEKIIDYIRSRYPNVAVGTVYNTLETFYRKGLIKKARSQMDVMRYDPVLSNHHHLYCSDNDRIEDYINEDLSELILNYFKTNHIPGFIIDDISLQIIGKFTNK